MKGLIYKVIEEHAITKFKLTTCKRTEGTFQKLLWVKNPPAIQETKETVIWSLGQEDPLEEGMEIHSSTLAWRIPWTEEPGGLLSIASQRVVHDWNDSAHTHTRKRTEDEWKEHFKDGAVRRKHLMLM